ncbi:MAG: hypothetical protein ING19_07630 [Azospirillum sp.]|nr:hypothetical protein [Azospirillum sp.]
MTKTAMTEIAPKKCRILYHDNCLDGVVAAAAAGYFVAMEKGGNGVLRNDVLRGIENLVEFTPVEYRLEKNHAEGKGSDPADLAKGYETVLVVDFSFSRDTIKRMCAHGGRIVVIDHHIGAVAQLGIENADGSVSKAPGMPANFEFVFDIKESGASLSWEHFAKTFEGVSPSRWSGPMPRLVRLTKDYDLWKHEDADSKALAAISRVEKWNPLEAARILIDADLLDEKIVSGRAVLKGILANAKEIAGQAAPIRLGGIVGWAVDAPSFIANEVADALRAQRKTGVFALYTQRRFEDETNFKVSLRGSAGVDVRAIAEKLGGGGHKAASSFETTPGDIGRMLEGFDLTSKLDAKIEDGIEERVVSMRRP